MEAPTTSWDSGMDLQRRLPEARYCSHFWNMGPLDVVGFGASFKGALLNGDLGFAEAPALQ